MRANTLILLNAPLPPPRIGRNSLDCSKALFIGASGISRRRIATVGTRTQREVTGSTRGKPVETVLLTFRPLPALQLSLDSRADHVKPHLILSRHGVQPCDRFIGQRQRQPDRPLFLPAHARRRIRCTKFCQSAPFSYVRY